MSGHSKWANIKHKKAASDKKKGKIFSKLGKEIMVAAKIGGGDPVMNPRLRTALLAARAANMPNANIERAVKKGSGELGDIVYEEIIYEGYTPGGAAVLVECLTDNRNRTAGEVRMVFDRSGGNLAGSGAVMWMFSRKAHFVIVGGNVSEEKLMDITLDAGAEDIEVDGDVAEIWGPIDSLEKISKALEGAGLTPSESGLVYKPSTNMEVNDEGTASKILKLVENLEDLDDVQAVHSNFDIAAEIMEKVG